MTLRLDPDVLDIFRAGRRNWQGQINAALKKAVGWEAVGRSGTI